MASLRARHRAAAIVVALFVPAVLGAACTISSESPDAAALGARAGPASGTTTTATAGGDTSGTPPPSAAEPQQDVPSADAAEAAEAPAGEDLGPDDAAGETPDTASAEGETPDTADAEVTAAEQPASTEEGDEPDGSTAVTADAGSDDDGSADGTEEESDGDDETPAPGDGTGAGGEGAFDERSKVSTVGIGAVYFGMSPEEAAERVGAVWAGIPPGGADCYVVTPSNGPPGVALWVYHGTVERVDVETPLLRTQSGLGVGTHIGELRSLLGEKLVVEEHPYLAGWILATFVPTDPNDAAFRIAFDISGGEVIRFRAGRTEIVSLEACA